MTASQIKPLADEPGWMQVMRHCTSCGKRVRIRVNQSTLASVHRAIAPGSVLFDQEFQSYGCKCGNTLVLTLRELGFG